MARQGMEIPAVAALSPASCHAAKRSVAHDGNVGNRVVHIGRNRVGDVVGVGRRGWC